MTEPLTMPTSSIPHPVPVDAPPVDAPPVPPVPSRAWPAYLRLWRGVPRELGYLAPTAILAVLVFGILNSVLGVVTGLLAVFVGILLLPFLLLGAWYLGRFELLRMRATRLAPIPDPLIAQPFSGPSVFRSLFQVLGVPYYWLAFVHGILVQPILAIATTVVWFGWGTATVGLLGAPVWAAIAAHGLTGHTTVIAIASVPLGLLLLALFPVITRGMTWVHWGGDRLLLGRFASDELRTELTAVSGSRVAALSAEDQALRRLERDIHDGPQQRLVRLQMDLASASRRLDDDPEGARELLGASITLAHETLDELRALTNGFAPPLLQDRGLAAALVALAARTPAAVEVRVDIPRQLPGELERSAYFVAAELLSNAAKHADAGRIALDARLEADAGGEVLRMAVRDDGQGGAVFVDGHGLAGMRERVQGLRGTLEVSSPAGGPTVVTAAIPVVVA